MKTKQNGKEIKVKQAPKTIKPVNNPAPWPLLREGELLAISELAPCIGKGQALVVATHNGRYAAIRLRVHHTQPPGEALSKALPSASVLSPPNLNFRVSRLIDLTSCP
jgi:hypothetical protein